MSFGSSNKTTQTSEPWKPVQDLLKLGIDDAKTIYDKQLGLNTSSNVVPYSKKTLQGYDNLTGIINANMGKKGLQSQYQDIINNGGFNDTQANSLRGIQNLISGLGPNGLSDTTDSVLKQYQRQMNSLGSNGLTSGQDSIYNTLRAQLTNLGQNGLTNTQDKLQSDWQNLYNSLGPNGLTKATDSALGGLQAQLKGLGINGLTNIQDETLQNLRKTANTDYSISANPGFRGVLTTAQNDARNNANMTAAAAGRYGSGVHQGAVTREVGNLTDRMVNDDYNRFLGRQDAANLNMANLSGTGLQQSQGLSSLINSLSQQGLSNKQGLGSSISNLSSQGLSQSQGLSGILNNLLQQGYGNTLNTGNAISNLTQQGQNNLSGLYNAQFNAGQAGMGNLANAYQGLQLPAQTAMQLGQMDEDLYRRTLDDRNRVQNLPRDNLAWLMSMANGTGNYNTTTKTEPSGNPFLNTVGQVSGGLNLLNGILSFL